MKNSNEKSTAVEKMLNATLEEYLGYIKGLALNTK